MRTLTFEFEKSFENRPMLGKLVLSAAVQTRTAGSNRNLLILRSFPEPESQLFENEN